MQTAGTSRKHGNLNSSYKNAESDADKENHSSSLEPNCMPIYAKSPKVTITFICVSKIVVQEMYCLIHISDFESIKCGKVQNNLILLYGN